jgi:hypothetical protein
VATAGIPSAITTAGIAAAVKKRVRFIILSPVRPDISPIHTVSSNKSILPDQVKGRNALQTATYITVADLQQGCGGPMWVC